MTRLRRIGVDGAVGLAAGLALAAQADAFSVSYDQTVTSEDDDLVMTSRVLIKDELFRVELISEDAAMVILRTPDGIYEYMPDERMAMKLPSIGSTETPVEGLEDYAGYLQRHNAQKTGSESVDGQPCDIYRFTNPRDGGTVTAWVRQAQPFPLKLQMDGPDGKITVALTHVLLDVPADDAAFRLPHGVRIMAVDEMMDAPE